MRTQFYIVQFVLTLLLVFVFPIMLFASNDSATSAQQRSDTVNVDIFKFKFAPQQITIKPGTTVRWVNKEKRQYHSVWFEKLGEPEPDYLFPDESYQRKFEKVGEFPYRCGPHPKMTGVVYVK